MLRNVYVAMALMATQELCLATPASSDNQDAVALLEATLQARYPMIAQWQITPVKNLQHKRRPELFAEPTAGAFIRHDGNLFSVETSPTAVEHYRVSGHQLAWVAKTYLAKNSVLQGQQLVQQPRDVFSLRCEPLTGDSVVTMVRLRRSVKANEILCRTDIESLPVVSRNDNLTIRCGSGSITVTAEGVALSDGELGQRIPVRRAGVYNALMATIINQGEVDACI